MGEAILLSGALMFIGWGLFACAYALNGIASAIRMRK
jgi:hypothetical protein